MIDKITPRPSVAIADELEEAGVENMQPVITSRRTYIAPFVNAEHAQYLVIEDDFPNGRPPLEKGRGVYMTDAQTVDLSGDGAAVIDHIIRIRVLSHDPGTAFGLVIGVFLRIVCCLAPGIHQRSRIAPRFCNAVGISRKMVRIRH